MLRLLVPFLIASVAALATRPDSVPVFNLLEERSLDGSPSVSVTFPDGYSDRLVLSKYYMNEEAKLSRSDDCNYIGRLEGEPDACVAMTGCPGSHDLEFTIMSEHSSHSTFKWLTSGKVEVVESPFKYGKGEAINVPVESEERGGEDPVVGDGVVDDPALVQDELNIEQQCAGGSCSSMPKSMLLKLKIGYMDSFLQKAGSQSAAVSKINSLMTHVQASYCHSSSLGTAVKIQVDNIKHYPGKTISPSGAGLEQMHCTTRTELGSSNLMVYLVYFDPPYGTPFTAGIAYRPAVCRPSFAKNEVKESINRFDPNSVSSSAQTVAHEMGHNLGMFHDFAPQHKAKCDKTGLMSYFVDINKWSTCSKADFQAHYLEFKNVWCLEQVASACGSAFTVTASNVQGPTTCLEKWQHQGTCKPENLNKSPYIQAGSDCCICYDAGTYNCIKKNTCIATSPSPAPAPAPVPAPAPPPAKPCGGKPAWIGDGWCDEMNNVPECKYDGGDCCLPNFKKNCNICKCIKP